MQIFILWYAIHNRRFDKQNLYHANKAYHQTIANFTNFDSNDNKQMENDASRNCVKYYYTYM